MVRLSCRAGLPSAWAIAPDTVGGPGNEWNLLGRVLFDRTPLQLATLRCGAAKRER